VISRLLSYRA